MRAKHFSRNKCVYRFGRRRTCAKHDASAFGPSQRFVTQKTLSTHFCTCCTHTHTCKESTTHPPSPENVAVSVFQELTIKLLGNQLAGALGRSPFTVPFSFPPPPLFPPFPLFPMPALSRKGDYVSLLERCAHLYMNEPRGDVTGRKVAFAAIRSRG